MEAGPAANNPGPRAVLRRYVPKHDEATHPRGNRIDCGAGRVSRLIVPAYVYRREDGSTFEIEQRIAEHALITCPSTGQKVERVLQPFSPRSKGPGFYSTDHRRSKAEADPANRAGGM